MDVMTFSGPQSTQSCASDNGAAFGGRTNIDVLLEVCCGWPELDHTTVEVGDPGFCSLSVPSFDVFLEFRSGFQLLIAIDDYQLVGLGPWTAVCFLNKRPKCKT